MSAKMEHHLLGLLWPLRQMALGNSPICPSDLSTAVESLAKKMQAALRERKKCPTCRVEFELGYDPRFCSYECYVHHQRNPRKEVENG